MIAQGFRVGLRTDEIYAVTRYDPWFLEQIRGIETLLGLIEPAKDAVGEEAVGPFTEKLNVKRAHRGGSYVLHQDFPYWERITPVAGQIMTAMISLDDANAENGCLQAAPGSHREGKQKRSGRFTGRRNHTKRAFVALKPGQEINFVEEAK